MSSNQTCGNQQFNIGDDIFVEKYLTLVPSSNQTCGNPNICVTSSHQTRDHPNTCVSPSNQTCDNPNITCDYVGILDELGLPRKRNNPDSVVVVEN